MKQILQSLSNGETQVLQVPLPSVTNTQVRIRSVNSLISLGTERMLVDFGRGNLLQKVQQQPEKVQMVLQKASTDGVMATYDAVKSKLDQPIALGYCQAGVVMQAGDSEFKEGDRVVSNGHHAEVVSVSRNLVARIPDSVSFETASFTPVAAIGLQGVRLVSPQIGETVVVMGLGLIGLLTVQILIAQGCKVIGTDFDKSKLEIAKYYGAVTIDLAEVTDLVAEVLALTGHIGADSVLITASTKSSDPVTHAARMSRQRGKIVLVGVTGLKLNRSDFYEKELSFQVSCSYGPGRYDPFYEDEGNDYPVGFVRWTEKRNFEAVLALMESRRLNVDKLISTRFAIENAKDAYDQVANDSGALGIILEYPESPDPAALLSTQVELPVSQVRSATDESVNLAVIGSGNYASRVLIPAFKESGAMLNTLVSRGGMTATHHGIVNGFKKASSEMNDVFQDESINAVAIATRHDSHADLVVRCIESEKHVFVEKPLAIDRAGLNQIKSALEQRGRSNEIALTVGFNRRFSPHVVKMKRLIEKINEPKCFLMTMNAGEIPADSWVQSEAVGGGRIIGEACHYIDLMRHLAGHKITSVQATSIGVNQHFEICEDKATITLGFEDGSMGTIHYFANGGKVFPKERIEVFARNAVLQLDNFRKLSGFAWPGFKKMNLIRQDKGQRGCTNAFVNYVKNGGDMPIPLDQILEVANVTLTAADQIRNQPQ